VGGKEVHQASRKMIANIIQPRVQEILGLVKNQLEKSRYQGMLPGGIVITGGAALTEGMVELATEVMERPVRLGFPEAVGGLADVIHSPVFATGIGLLSYAARHHTAEVERSEGLFMKDAFSKIKKWFKDLF
jgi:cell division protein FtsA